MIQRVEKQKQVTHNPPISREVAATANRVINNLPKELEPGTNGRRRYNKAKSALFCDHC